MTLLRAATSTPLLLACQASFESLLARELPERHAVTIAEKGPG